MYRRSILIEREENLSPHFCDISELSNVICASNLPCMPTILLLPVLGRLLSTTFHEANVSMPLNVPFFLAHIRTFSSRNHMLLTILLILL